MVLYGRLGYKCCKELPHLEFQLVFFAKGEHCERHLLGKEEGLLTLNMELGAEFLVHGNSLRNEIV